jgi:uncharacterized membrane protein YdjX (TVP38/TMEM64 family)
MTVKQEIADGPAPPWQRHWQKLAALLIWGLLLGGYFWYAQSNSLGWQDILSRSRTSIYGPLVYMGLYILRPLIFFPASILTVAGGFFFGALGGTIYSVVAGNLAALLAYLVGRYFGRGLLVDDTATGLMQRYARRLRSNSLEAVLLMRFLLLPFDFVSYLAGFLRINWKAYLLGTLVGTFPALFSLVLIGVSGDVDLQSGKFSINPWTLLASGLLMLVSIGVSRYFRKREDRR